jgi:hypothetical protein
MSLKTEEILDNRLPHFWARKAKRMMLSADEMEQLLYDSGADMAEVQVVMDQYIRLHGD